MVRAITDGRRLRVDALPDSLRISFGVNANAESSGIDLLSSILQRPLLRDGMKAERVQGFYAPILRAETASSAVPAEELSYLFRQIVRPERMRIAMAGPVSSDVGAKIALRFAAFVPASKANPYRKRQTLALQSPDAQGLLLTAPAVPFDAPDLSSRIIAWAGVGVGKGSALFRASRERLGMSYRQEGLLVATSEGFRPTLLVATDKPDAEGLRKTLREEIERWTDADVVRAKGILRANQETGLPLSPFLVSADGPPSYEAADRAFLAAYWPLRTGRPWDPLYWAADVKLDDMKRLALEMVEAAK